jgi:hypothetical protein
MSSNGKMSEDQANLKKWPFNVGTIQILALSGIPTFKSQLKEGSSHCVYQSILFS